jgi:2-deoxy-D-gluconate 3-dehydrogenase
MSTLTTSRPTPLADLIDLSGRTAVVTGAAMGIGRAIAERLHEAGAAVLVADIDELAARVQAGRLCEARADSAHGIRADVSDRGDVDAMVTAAVELFGRLDILVNNAGIYPVMPFLEVEPALFERVLRVNLMGTFLAMQAAARQMIAQGRGGKIINITSIDAVHPSMAGLGHYDASKHGAWGLTKNAALELAPYRIAVNALAPGGVDTPGTHTSELDVEALRQIEQRIPMHRMADADEMGRVAVFLASDLSSYLTGSQIVADGGLLLR